MRTTQKGFIIPLFLVIAAAIVIGGGVYVYKEDKRNSELESASTTANVQTNSEINVQAPPISASAGLKGKVSIGPTCPVMIDNDVENTCSDKPYATTFQALTLNGQIVKSFSSDESGNYSVELPPGQYKIISTNSIQAGPSVFPTMSAVNSVTVNDSGYTTLNITFDSGIR